MENLIKKAVEVKNRYQTIWMEIDNVAAVGTGITSGGKPGIIISIEQDKIATRNIFPAEVEGVPIEFKISGSFKAT